MDDDDFGPIEPDTAHQFKMVDIAPLVLNLVEGIVGAFHSTAVIAYNMAARHANFRAQQDAFREQASLEIERITTEHTDG